jgi:hypothetical protein
MEIINSSNALNWAKLKILNKKKNPTNFNLNYLDLNSINQRKKCNNWVKDGVIYLNSKTLRLKVLKKIC